MVIAMVIDVIYAMAMCEGVLGVCEFRVLAYDESLTVGLHPPKQRTTIGGVGTRVQSVGLGPRVQGPGPRAQGPGTRVQSVGPGSRVQGPGSRVWVQGPGSRVQGPGSRVWVQGPGSRVQGPGCRCPHTRMHACPPPHPPTHPPTLPFQGLATGEAGGGELAGLVAGTPSNVVLQICAHEVLSMLITLQEQAGRRIDINELMDGWMDE